MDKHKTECTESKESPESFISRVRELAKETENEYQKLRNREANRFGIDVTEFDLWIRLYRLESRRLEEIERLDEVNKPWPDEVDGKKLLKDLTKQINSYLIIPEYAEVAMAFWAVFAHCHDAFGISPYLHISSPEKRCGKSTALDVMSKLLVNPLQTSNLPEAVIWRFIDEHHSPILLDEADRGLNNSDSIIKTLNMGWRRNGSRVPKTNLNTFKIEHFSVWSPKIIAGIGEMDDTLKDRSIPIEMKRKLPAEKVKRFRFDKTPELDKLKRQLIRFSADNVDKLPDLDPVMPRGLDDRQEDNWRPLVAIADLIGGEWAEITRKAAVALAKVNEEKAGTKLDNKTALLMDCRYVFDKFGKDELSLRTEIMPTLIDMPESRWATYNGRDPIAEKQFSKLLSNYEIVSKKDGVGNMKWRRCDFEEDWKRFDPAGGALLKFDSVHSGDSVHSVKQPKVASLNGFASVGSVVELDVTCLETSSVPSGPSVPQSSGTYGLSKVGSNGAKTFGWDEDKKENTGDISAIIKNKIPVVDGNYKQWCELGEIDDDWFKGEKPDFGYIYIRHGKKITKEEEGAIAYWIEEERIKNGGYRPGELL